MTWAKVIGSLIMRPERSAIGRDERALLDAVIAAPDDDGPRLVYADWLQHRGDELDAARGELIAVQCALANLDDPIEHNRLKARDFELVERHGNVWCAQAGIGDVRNNWHPSAWAADFQRGFVETVEMAASAYTSVATRLFALEPVRALMLVGPHTDRTRRLPESIYLRHLHTFGVRNSYLSDAALAALVASPMLAGVVRLRIERQALEPLTIAAVGRATLRELSLRDTDLGLADLLPLLRSPMAARLETLVLDDNPIGDDGAFALAQAPALAQLRRLSLGGLVLGADARQQLVDRFGAAVEL